MFKLSTKLERVIGAVGALVPLGRQRRRMTERVIVPRREDFERAYPSIGLTPSRVLAILQSADHGAPQLQFELFGEMLQKWPRLAAVEATRRLALTGLEWEIVADGAMDEAHGEEAMRAAEYCRTVLHSISTFSQVLDHLAHAIGYGIGAAELVWERGALVDIVPVPFSRLSADWQEPWRLRVRTEDDPGGGVALDEAANKWIVHQPTSLPGRHFDGGLLRASALLYLAQNLSFKDWLIYSQIAGMPLRVAQYEIGTPEADKQALLKMLEALGTDAVAVLSKGVELKLLEASRGEGPYLKLQEYCNTEITILWLGQHLTTDVQGSGSRAAAEVHDRVREDLLVDDIADEGLTIRRDLLTPLVRAKFGDATPVPLFRRSLAQSIDSKKLAETLAIVVRDLGVEVPRAWLHRTLGIPEPLPGEAVVAAGQVRS